MHTKILLYLYTLVFTTVSCLVLTRAPYQSPFADPGAIQNITNDLGNLSIKSVNLEEDVSRATGNTLDDSVIIEKYSADFNIVDKIPSCTDQCANDIRNSNNVARDVATRITSELDEYVLILSFVETITDKEMLQELVNDLKDIAKTPNPLQATPLEGYQSVTSQFDLIWSLRTNETEHVIDVLEKASDITQTIQELTTELKPVKEGIANVQKALKGYASYIHN